MKLKTKLVSALTMFCLTVAMLFVGVWAASSADVTLGGTISFKSKNVYATVEATIEGAVGATNPTTLTFSAETPNPDKSSWSKNLTFDENGSMITITLKITNLATDRPLYASVTDNYGVVTNLDKTISEGANALTLEAANDGDTDTAEVTITLKVNNPDASLDGASYGYFVDLNSDEPINAVELDENNQYNGLKFTFANGGASVSAVSVSTLAETVTIPAQVKATDGTIYNVTSIAYEGFKESENLNSIIIPEGVTSIGEGAFVYCLNLQSIYIPVSLNSVGSDAFYSCNSLANVYYAGTEQQWTAITISNSENAALTSATIHYDQTF